MSPRKCCDCARPTFGVRCSLCEFDRTQSPPGRLAPGAFEVRVSDEGTWTWRNLEDRSSRPKENR